MSVSSLHRMILTLVVALLVAGGCTVPGASRLEGPPKDLPPALSYVTADVLGYSLYDTDPGSKLWEPLAPIVGAGSDNEPLQVLHSALTGGFPADLAKVRPWVGSAAGIALRELDLDGAADTSTMYWADVRSRRKLERFLDDAGWEPERGAKLGDDLGEQLTLWTTEAGCDDTPNATQAVCASPPYPRYTAVGVGDDAVVAARTPKALRSLLVSADEYAVPERRAMSKFTVEAASRVPMSAVYRFDLIRTQMRRPFEADPALLEFARWATDAATLVALRDGWFGIAPPLKGAGSSSILHSDLRVVGAGEWVPDLAPEITLEPVPRALLERIDGAPSVAIAMHDPGQYLADLLGGITYKGTQYATEQDVAKDEDKVELLPVLEQLDGDGVVAWVAANMELTASVAAEDPVATASAVEEALDTAGLRSVVIVDAKFVDIRVSFGARIMRDLSTVLAVARDVTIDRAGTPPRPPVAWMWSAGTRCTGPSGGWLTFDGTDRLTTSLSVSLRPSTGGSSAPCNLLGAFGLSSRSYGLTSPGRR